MPHTQNTQAYFGQKQIKTMLKLNLNNYQSWPKQKKT